MVGTIVEFAEVGLEVVVGLSVVGCRVVGVVGCTVGLWVVGVLGLWVDGCTVAVGLCVAGLADGGVEFTVVGLWVDGCTVAVGLCVAGLADGGVEFTVVGLNVPVVGVFVELSVGPGVTATVGEEVLDRAGANVVTGVGGADGVAVLLAELVGLDVAFALLGAIDGDTVGP